ncbi:MAG: Hpt domain-containing protein [Candidatus Brocadiaceae bacterium]
MDKKESEFLKRLLKTFRIEAKEHLDTMSSGILELEKSPSAEKRMEIIEHMFREAHSLKGAARTVNLVNIGSVCQSLEGVFAALKRQEISLSAQLFNVLYQTLDILTGLSGETEQTGAERPPVEKLINELENIAHGGTEPLQRKW